MGRRIFWCSVKRACKADGDIIELGVGKGGDAGQFCAIETGEYIRDRYPDKKIYACDCFKGLPWGEEFLSKGECFSETAEQFIKRVKDKSLQEVVIPVVGLFEDTLKTLTDKKFCFAWVDADLYESTLTAVKFLLPRMTEGSIMGFHDYCSDSCVGVKKVVDKYLLNNPDFEQMETGYSGIYIFFERKEDK